jgi:hypothetical protein
MGTGLGATVAAGAISGAVSGQAARATENALSGQEVTAGLGEPADIATEAVVGGALAGVGYGIGRLARPAVAEATVERAAKEVRFAQKGISKVFRHGEFAGKTIDEIAQGLKSGAIHPDQLPIKVIERDGVMYALNNRSLMALRLAGLEPTVIENVTGQEFFERQLTERLLEIGSEVGPDFVPIIRGGP